MSTLKSARRSTSAPGGLNSHVVSSSRKSGSNGAAASSAVKRGSGSTTEDGSGLIVTRGLQEILNNDRRFRRPEEPSPMEKASKGGSKSGRRGSGQAPNFVMCYLCGRQFGSSSVDIHRPQCYLKKMIEWERADPSIRGPRPMTPEAHEKMMKERVASASASAAGGAAGHPGASKLTGTAGSRRANEIDLYNQIQMDAYNETALSPCPNCGRTFLPDRLQVHLRSCKPGNTARPVHRLSASTPISATGTSASAPPAAAGGASGVTKTAASAAPNARERPIRASGSYAVPSSAGPDDLPPRTAGTDNTAIRARGSYAIPEDAGADSVPTQAPSAKKPSRGPSLSHASAVVVVAQRGFSEAGTEEEAEPRDTVMDVEADEVKPPSPRADTERRLSSVAILRGDPDMSGSSAPNRPASMERGSMAAPHAISPEEDRADGISVVYSLSQSRGREHAAGSRPRKQSGTSAPRTAQMPELVSETHEETEEAESEVQFEEEELQSAAVVGGRAGQICRVVECAPEVEDNTQQGSSSERRKWAPKKIPLNNVSRFKNVESRLQLQRTAELSMFVPCQYCGRTFVPERLQRHEECCSERNKPPPRRSAQVKARPSSAPAATVKRAKSASAPAPSTSNSASLPGAAAVSTSETKAPSPPPAKPSGAAATIAAPAAAPAPATGRSKFCGGCGVRVSNDVQKFCTECGFKL